MTLVDRSALYRWCKIPAKELVDRADLRIPLRIVRDSVEMGEVMASDLVEGIECARSEGRPFRVIVPCGPKAWYEPFTRMVNEQRVSLRDVHVFHMDECLDWQGNTLPEGDPHNFRTFMDTHFYGGVSQELAIPPENRHYIEPSTIHDVVSRLGDGPIDLTIGGWGQDGHVAYNQARRNPYSVLTVEQLRSSSVRIQENNSDTILALAQRSLGAAYQFVPPMSITLGMKECLSAKRVRVYSDTGPWKQTALRVALFSEETVEYPMTLLQSHPDALITATMETAGHPISEHPEWAFAGVDA